MTMTEVYDYLEYFGKFEATKRAGRIRDWILVDRRQDLSWIEENRIGKVIKRYG